VLTRITDHPARRIAALLAWKWEAARAQQKVTPGDLPAPIVGQFCNPIDRSYGGVPNRVWTSSCSCVQADKA
jgi:hypothetical protein